MQSANTEAVYCRYGAKETLSSLLRSENQLGVGGKSGKVCGGSSSGGSIRHSSIPQITEVMAPPTET